MHIMPELGRNWHHAISIGSLPAQNCHGYRQSKVLYLIGIQNNQEAQLICQQQETLHQKLFSFLITSHLEASSFGKITTNCHVAHPVTFEAKPW